MEEDIVPVQGVQLGILFGAIVTSSVLPIEPKRSSRGSWINELAFRTMWSEFEWENKVNINTSITEANWVMTWGPTGQLFKIMIYDIPSFYSRAICRKIMYWVVQTCYCFPQKWVKPIPRWTYRLDGQVEVPGQQPLVRWEPSWNTLCEIPTCPLWAEATRKLAGNSGKPMGGSPQFELPWEPVHDSTLSSGDKNQKRANSLQKMCKRCCGMQLGHLY